MQPAYVYRAKLNRVIDGDTYVLDVDLGFRVWASLTIRLHGVNSPEMNTPEGKAAAEYVNGVLAARDLLVESYKDRQSFARWVADVWVRQDFGDYASLAGQLLQADHAVAI